MSTWRKRFISGLTAFREAWVSSDIEDADTWDNVEARRLRYQMLWAAYEQTTYRDVHTWANAVRKQYALYEFVRNIYSPTYRLAEFYKTHLFGGQLNSAAEEDGAIPITTDNEALRPAIATLWRNSRWAVNKDILTLKGCVLGDTAIQVIDDVKREQVYLEIVYPGIIVEVDRDPFGNVKSYIIEETRTHPIQEGLEVTYREEVSRDGNLVVYETFLNDTPYAWPENIDRTGEAVSAWAEPYGFVPFVMVQHNDVGQDFGWSEFHPLRSKMQEADDVAAMISDQIRKYADPHWLFKGMSKPKEEISTDGADATVSRPEPGREEMHILWGPKDAGMEAMVADMHLDHALAHLASILEELERDAPELSTDIHTASGDASGRALRVARQRVIAKVIQRRVNYDAGMVAANQMAIAIGGFRGYRGYEGFGLESYAGGALDHTIGDRPVFEADPLDQTEIDAAFWKAAEQAMKAGVGIEAYLREAGWNDEHITDILR